jgi:hypothetical protein
MSDIDRRAFLRRMGFGTVAAAAAATSIYDIDKLLWVPGEKKIFIMPLELVTDDEIFHWMSERGRFIDVTGQDLDRYAPSLGDPRRLIEVRVSTWKRS